MSKTYDSSNESIVPTQTTIHHSDGKVEVVPYFLGLTKREYFVTEAMKGLLSNSSINLTREEVASEAVKIADALVKELYNTTSA